MNSSSDFFSGHSFGDVQVLPEKKSKQPFWHVLALPTVSEKVGCWTQGGGEGGPRAGV